MKPLVIYHANCTDGFGAAFAAWLKLGDWAEYLPMEYGRVPLHTVTTCTDRDVYILDFSFPKETMDAIFMYAKRVVWLDHHKTAFEMWCETERVLHCEDDRQPENNRFILLDNNKSGALLAWEYFHPVTEVPMFIQHIDDRDRWQFKLDGTKELHAALNSYKPWSFKQWSCFFMRQDGEGPLEFNFYQGFYNSGKAILRAHNQNVQAALKQTRPCAIQWFNGETDGHPSVNVFTGLAANAPAFLASDLGHELANKSGTFGFVWSMAADGQVNCSLRSNGEYDVSAIAKVFGGGGHRNAAGFSTDINTLLSWLK